MFDVFIERFKEDRTGNILVALILAIGIVLAGVCVSNELRNGEEAPLVFPNPYFLESTTVAVGEPIVSDQVVCNNTGSEMILDTAAAWVPLEEGSALFPGPPVLGLVLPAGCHPSHVEIPTTYVEDGETFFLPPGKWVRTGLATIKFPFSIPSVSFASEPFEVVDLHELLPEQGE
jgi:hypothetical protein